MAGTIRYSPLDTQSRFGEIVIILSIASVVSTIAVALRCYARLFILRCFGRDDGVMVAAQILSIGSAAAIGLEAHWGLGRHTWMVKPENIIPYMKAFYSSIVVYNIAVCFTKISIMLQYKRIFANRIMQQLTKFGLYFLAAWAFTLAFLLTLTCMPVAAFWDSSVKGRCLDSPTIWYVMAGVNLATDFAILIMPMPAIKSLQLPRRQKFMLIAIFGLGLFPCAISIYRVRTLHTATDTTDPFWDNVDAATWSFLELSCGILAACLPTLRPIFMAAMPRLFGSSVASSLRSRTMQSAGRAGDGRSVKGAANPYASQVGGGDVAGYGPSKELDSSSSTEGLHLERGSSSGGEEDLEFGGMERSRGASRAGPGAGVDATYSVSVVAGSDPAAAEAEREKEMFGGRGIKTTTVVTQQVTFENTTGGRRGSQKRPEGRRKGEN
ncbi:hypothetical protein B0H67DRAFT_662214 [Lasiosphaeris hirsuta]|uniref:Rhodopsin domain-containing protein n=1 Tax=Lasiosphaeris hirsuta TaxID=260670 RepID=A0AA40E0B1_9PEZI|nr:hypothetical protein B0H67DRAFT_662214 [Lasiosphaeris hirsuta]